MHTGRRHARSPERRAKPQGAPPSALIPARLDVALVDPPRELRLSARGEDASLLDPVLALDAAAKIEQLAHAVDVRAGPIGDLVVTRDAERVELLLDQHADATDPLEVVGRTSGTRGRAAYGIRRRLPDERLGADRAQSRQLRSPGSRVLGRRPCLLLDRIRQPRRTRWLGIGRRRGNALLSFHAARERRHAALGEDLRLLDPIAVRDTRRPAGHLIEARHVGGRPGRDLGEPRDAVLLQ